MHGNLPHFRPVNVPSDVVTSQFSKERLTDFGELPKGQIPNALESSPRSQLTQLDNGVRVFTENYSQGFATVSVFVKAGSRFETIESSGSAHFVAHMVSKNSASKTRDVHAKKLAGFGSGIEVSMSRELVGFTMRVLAEDAAAATEFLLDAVVNQQFDANQIEADKEILHQKVLDVSRDQFEHTREAIFYTAFRDHMMGQSKYGIRDNIPSLQKEHLEEFHKRNYVGENIVVVVSGQAEHATAVDAARKAGQAAPARSSGPALNKEKPLLTPSVMVQRDDEMYNLNVGVGLIGPGYSDPNYLAMKFIEQIMGNYNAAKDGQAHLNASNRQYNQYHYFLGNMQGVLLQKTEYLGFSDVGLFTGITHGNDFWGKENLYTFQTYLTYYAHNLSQTDVFRARAALFNDLLHQAPSAALNTTIARDIFYNGRRLSRTEMAYRFSNLACTSALKKVIFDTFYDKDLSVAAWGPGHNIMSFAGYDSRFMNSTKANFLNVW